ncbi:hypothetical protein L227DRAFT_570996 [Lentinus tigrinus ALCF2SS1-6]|uniref:F-box domain-containing protein n=2 Tax=Lentinus tigrinus TaxID=5365 RepID=A0A5C2SQS5_9APHY|nr:hypothetical protein L227DRAFT_570996 [Lentinus tigrinus ALCF2SS1-6]
MDSPTGITVLVTGIDNLPFELLIHISRFIRPEGRGDVRYAHICQRWRAAIHDTAEFWRDMLGNPFVLVDSLGKPNRQVGNFPFFQLTRQLPLHITLLQRDFAVLKTLPLVQNLHRLSILTIEWEQRDERSEFRDRMLALGPLPSLEVLSCTYQSASGPSQGRDTPPHTAPDVRKYPKLRHLEVNADFLSYAMVVPHLKTLIIGAGYISLREVLDALRCCPLLESLQFHAVHETPHPVNIKAVHLPHLRVLDLRDAEMLPRFVTCILKTIHCPPTTHVSIMILPYSFLYLSSYFPRDHAGSHTTALSAVLDTVSALEFMVAKRGRYERELWLKWSVPGEDEPRLAISMPYQTLMWNAYDDLTPGNSQAPYPYIESIAEAFSSETITALRIDLADEPTPVYMRRIEWTTLFDAFPALVALATRVRSCAGLLRALRQEPFRPTRLEKLEITCANKKRLHHGLVVTLEMRAAQGLRLHHLGFSHSNEDASPFSEWHLMRLKDVVAEVVT